MANLYRAAYYLAKDRVGIGQMFLARAQKKLDFELKMNTSKSNRYWAEKVLDQYKKFTNSNY